MRQGLVYVFTGEGKGKTSAALGVGVRAALSGMKVAMVCWYKSRGWNVSEYKLPKKLSNFEIFPMGVGFRITNYELRIKNKEGKQIKIASLEGGGKVVDHATEEEHKKAAKAALEKAENLIGKVEVLILDEVNNAFGDKLIKASDVVDLVRKRGKTHVILTGRDAPKSFLLMADLVTEMRKIKHPFDKGKKAVRGLDY